MISAVLSSLDERSEIAKYEDFNQKVDGTIQVKYRKSLKGYALSFHRTSPSESAELIKSHSKTQIAPFFNKVEDPTLLIY